MAQLLRSAGHDALTVIDQTLGGEGDRRIVDVCNDEDRTLVTLDMDFSDQRTYPPEQHHGLVVLRLRRQDKYHVLEIISKLIPILESEEIIGRLWIVEENRVRIRGEIQQ